MIAFFLSGWTFFFRWPVARVARFRPEAILLGPFLQAAVFAAFAASVSLLPRAPVGLAAFFGFVGLGCLSGFFHEDGFADTADSLGVSKFDSTPETLDRIHRAMKDSCLGSFGVSALALLWLFRAVACFVWKVPWIDACAWVFLSRSLAFGIAWVLGRVSPSANAARSGHLMKEISPTSFALFCVACCGVGFVLPGVWRSPAWAVSFLGSGSGGSLFLYAVARRSQGLSGDLIGACVCFCEILIGVLVTSL